LSVFGITVAYRVGSEEGPDVLARLSVAFERAGAELVDMGRHVFPLLPTVFEDAEKRQFDAQGSGPVSGTWADLSDDYAEWKAQKYPGMPILEATGALRSGLTESASPFGSREWTSSEFSFGTAGVEYASFHQSGTGKMPPRPPFDFDSQFEADLLTAARKGVNSAIRAANLEPMVGSIPE
jgi:phage gpG-like protein